MKDMHSHLLIVSAIGAVLASADVASAAIDLQGYNGAELVLAIGAGGIAFSDANRIDVVLVHSDNGVDFDPVEANDVLGSSGLLDGIVKSFVAAHAQPSVHRFGYKGGRRYLKVSADFGGVHGTGTPIAVMVIKGHGANTPEVDQA